MPPVTFTDTQTWYASLATMYGAAAALITNPSGEVLLRNPITGIVGGCPRAANGHTAPAPPRTKSRRLMRIAM